MADPATAVGAGIGLFMIFFFLSWILFFIAIILGMIFWIFMIVDVAKRDFKQENDKVMWILIVVLTGIIGSLIYYFMIKRPDKH